MALKRSGFKQKSLDEIRQKQAEKRIKALNTPKPAKKPVGAKNKRPKLPKPATVRNKCDKLLTPIIIGRHPVCFLQGSEHCNYHSQVAHHHIKKSRSTPLRYELDNLIPLCHACHLMLHNNESKWVAILIEKKGLEWALNLNRIDREANIKVDVHYYLENLDRLSTELENTP
jgi:hypothetical protein